MRSKSSMMTVEPAVSFVNQSIAISTPANTIIFIDTYSCVSTGFLQYAGGTSKAVVLDLKEVCDSKKRKKKKKTNGVDNTLIQLLNWFVGSRFWKAISTCSESGCSLVSDPQRLSIKNPTLNIGNPGSMNIVVMMSCGPAMTNSTHMRICQKEVAE